MPIFYKKDKTVLFIHIPKTAGSSIEHIFVQSGYKKAYHDGGGTESLNYVRKCSPQHMHAELLKSNFNLTQFDAVFTFVRNPMSRFLSEYAMRHRNSTFIDEKDIEKWFDYITNIYKKNPYVQDNHIRKQVDFLINNCEIFKLENGVKSGLELLDEKYDLKLNLLNIPQNTSSTNNKIGDSRKIKVSDKLVEKINLFYKEDFIKFGY